MSLDAAIDLIRESLLVMLLVSAPILAAALLIGLLISLIQAVTQIQEQTLSFVPKIVGMAVVAILLAPWMTRALMEFAVKMFGST
jgi:flagellar biosynthesis protein FliQ